jgi:hypothetical protein
MICRQCFRERAAQIGFEKVNYERSSLSDLNPLAKQSAHLVTLSTTKPIQDGSLAQRLSVKDFGGFRASSRNKADRDWKRPSSWSLGVQRRIPGNRDDVTMMMSMGLFYRIHLHLFVWPRHGRSSDVSTCVCLKQGSRIPTPCSVRW